MAISNRLLLFLLFISTYSHAQVQLTNFYPQAANYQDTLFIVGSGFGEAPASLSVSIGAGTAEIVSIKDQLIKVIIPNSATYGIVNVSDLSRGENIYFSTPFTPTYLSSGFDNSMLSENEKIITEEAGLYDLCACDFDQDGDVDIATVNNDEAAKLSSVNVFSNTSSNPDNVNFTKVEGAYFNINQAARNVICSDINGDGKADLIVSQGGTEAQNIYVYQNTSTTSSLTFASPKILNTAAEGLNNGTRRIEVHDLDGDHKPEIIVSNQTAAVLVIFKNESTSNQISFPADKRQFIEVPTNTLGLVINDLDNDHKADIITANNLGSNLYIIKNISTSGTLKFSSPQTISVSGQLVNIASGDIDGDGKQDIVLTDFDDGAIILLLNQSSSSQISFDTPNRMNVAFQPWGITLADIAGNMQTDIIVSTLASTDKILILKNNSIPGAPSFELIQAGSPSSYRNIKVADINHDAKPDIITTESDALGNNYVNYIENLSCLEVSIYPDNIPAICESNPVTLSTRANANHTYQWYKDGSTITGANQASFEVSESGVYYLEVTDTYSACISTSDDIVIIEESGEIPDVPEINVPAQICVGDDLTLSAANDPTLSYHWSGPNGFSSHEASPIITNVNQSHAGEYLLEVKKGACSSNLRSVFVNIIPQHTINIEIEGSLMLCSQDSVILKINDAGLNNIQWYKDELPLTTQSGQSIKIGDAGSYFVSAENSYGCSITSSHFTVERVPLNAAFSMSTNTSCVGDEIIFTNNEPSNHANITYEWDFGDGSQATNSTSIYSFEEAGTYTITHSVIVGDGACSVQTTSTVSILAKPIFEISSTSDIICDSDSIILSVPEIGASIAWEDGSNSRSRIIREAGEYSVSIYHENGCSDTQSIEIRQGVSPEVTIDTDGEVHIIRGDSVQLFASGADFYQWTSTEGLQDSTIATPFVKPNETTTYAVMGYSEDGCATLAEITIFVDIDEITLDALDIYSPNGDGIEDAWEIKNIDQFPGCHFLIFDLQGREVYQSSTPYQGNWEGTDNNGNNLPEGVYYYVVRCTDDTNKASGSVTILR